MTPQSFEATVDPMPWGDEIYTVIRVPDEVVAALDPTKRVEGDGADYPGTLTRAPAIERVFLWGGARRLNRMGLEPEDRFDVHLRPAPDNAVEGPFIGPEDVTTALRAVGKTGAREALTAGKRRGLLHAAQSAKRADMRARRIAALVPGLGA
ncbi:MAG: YdeI/OmpD-associated family protein [Pseudomonadota bacterium]